MLCASVQGINTAFAGDFRFSVNIPREQTAIHNRPMAWIKAGLPVVLRRIVPRNHYGELSKFPPRLNMVEKIVPGNEGVLILYKPEAIFEELKKEGIPYIQTPPRFKPMISLRNKYGREMHETKAELLSDLKQVASDMGLDLHKDAPLLILQWHWIDDRGKVELRVRGPSLIQEFSSTRTIPPNGDPLPHLKSWLRDVFFTVRDAYASFEQPVLSEERVVSVYLNLGLSLDAQVALEETLQKDARVADVLPFFLSPRAQGYRIRLRGSDDAWLPDWFLQHGIRLVKNQDGVWTAQ